MAPSPGGRGPAKGASGGDRSARSLKAFAEEAERDRSNPEELARLLKSASEGDADALKRVFNENLAMVLRRAHQLAGTAEGLLSEDELLQEGSVALTAEIREYAAGYPGVDAAMQFSAHAEDEVVERMTRALDEQRSAERAKRQLVEDAQAYERAEISIRRDKKREATTEELAEKLEWPPEKTRLLGEMVAEARRQHDEELLQYIEPDELSELDDE
jgi:RNA polymerase primary sigma factor